MGKLGEIMLHYSIRVPSWKLSYTYCFNRPSDVGSNQFIFQRHLVLASEFLMWQCCLPNLQKRVVNERESESEGENVLSTEATKHNSRRIFWKTQNSSELKFLSPTTICLKNERLHGKRLWSISWAQTWTNFSLHRVFLPSNRKHASISTQQPGKVETRAIFQEVEILYMSTTLFTGQNKRERVSWIVKIMLESLSTRSHAPLFCSLKWIFLFLLSLKWW